MTKKIIKKVILPNSNTIDIGCHKGEILCELIKHAPKGKHFAFEPIPNFYTLLIEKYGNEAQIYPYALSTENKQTTFHYVKNAPAYSGINKRKYAIDNPVIEKIDVEVKRLDDVIPTDVPIHFIKIDVEGGEFDVMQGGKELLLKNQPTILFECGLGATEYYNTKAKDIYAFLTNEIGLKVFTLNDWIAQKPSLTNEQFCKMFNDNTEYYFIADKD
ncbi:MAG: FkbM family methyltransferase [Vicingaceae bacterium]|nr:FkbM family methyltransferase [Vicingaceae bacterium]